MPDLSLGEYIIKHHKTHLIFDFDGTLAYAKFPWKQWGVEVRDELRALDAELWDAHEYRGSGPAQNEFVKRHGEAALTVLQRHNAVFEMRYRDAVVRNNALLREVAQFRDSYQLFMWTSNTRQLIDWVLADNNMADWFEKIVTRNDVRFLKPSPEGFALIHDPTVPKENYVLVGDSSHDRGAAEAAGIAFYYTDDFGLGR